MPRTLIPFVAAVCLLMTGCTTQIFLQNPVHGHSSSYKTRPMVIDSLASATYFSGHISIAGTNDRTHDIVMSGTASVHRAHTFGIFQGYYGLNLIAGNYHLGSGSFDSYQQDPKEGYSDSYDSKPSYSPGNRFFGAAGATGGFSLNLPISSSGDQAEWRLIGAEFNYHREFGDYYRFRKQLSDTVASFVERRNNHFTCSLFSEVVFRNSYQETIGFKMGYVVNATSIHTDLKRKTDRDDYVKLNEYLRAGWLSSTLHYTHGKKTYSGQVNFGTKLVMIQMGLNYRLGK